MPNLLVDQMVTGQSIKMRFSNKKGFSIITKKDDFIINVPRSIGTCLIITWLLLTGYKTILETEKLRLENIKTKLEIEKLDSALNNKVLEKQEAFSNDPFLSDFKAQYGKESADSLKVEGLKVSHSIEMLYKYLTGHEYITRVTIDSMQIRAIR